MNKNPTYQVSCQDSYECVSYRYFVDFGGINSTSDKNKALLAAQKEIKEGRCFEAYVIEIKTIEKIVHPDFV